MKKSNLKTLTILLLSTILSMFLLSACSAPALSADFNEEDVKQSAQDVVTLLNAQDTEGLRMVFNERLNAAISDDVFVQIYAAVEGAGNFESFDNITVVGSTDKNTGEEFATAVVAAKYENQTLTYTLSFDKQMQLAGLYYR